MKTVTIMQNTTKKVANKKSLHFTVQNKNIYGNNEASDENANDKHTHNS